MRKAIRAAVLPVGEINTDQIKEEYALVLSAFERLSCDLFPAAPVSNMESARLSVQELSHQNPDLLVLVPVRGLSAETIEASARMSPAPCLILPVKGNYALPSSALAIGALRDSKVPVELLYAPPDHPEFDQRLGLIFRVAKAFARIRQSRIGVIGSLFPNLIACHYDSNILSSKLGVTLIPKRPLCPCA